MRINQLKLGSILSYLQTFLGVIIGLIYTPFMIGLLGQNEYGLYNTVASTIATLSVLSLGFNSSYIKFYSQYKDQDNADMLIAKLNGLFQIVFFTIGFISLVCGLFLSANLDLIFSEGLTIEEYHIARILMIILTINLSISFSTSVFSNIISAHERFVFLKAIGMLKTVVSPLVTFPLLLIGYRSIAMVVVSVVISGITDLIYMIYAIKVLHSRFTFRNLDFCVFKQLLMFSGFIAINIVVDQVNNNIDKVLLGRYKGTAEVAIYAVAASLYSYYQSVSLSISGVFTPRIHQIVNTNKDKGSQGKKLTELFVKVGRIQFLLLSLVVTGILFFGEFFITKIWAGVSFGKAYYVALLLVIPAIVPLMQNLGIEIQRAQNLHRYRSIIYLIMAIVNLILSIFLAQKYGAVGAAIGTAISFTVANGVIMNIFYHKRCNINIITFWKNIINVAKGLVIPIVFGVIICYMNFVTSLYTFCVFGGGYVIIFGISMWFFGMNEYEKNLLISILRKK